MNDAMRVREAQATDVDAVIDLWERAGVTRPWNDPRLDFERALSGSTSSILVAEDAEGLAATAMVGYDGHRGWVYYLAVAAERRGSGVGRVIMSAAEAWLLSAGAPKVEVMVRRDNAAAVGFYESLGYSNADVEVLARWLD
jgi:ribosomal protein S18 acetylase RimI-like enzyme